MKSSPKRSVRRVKAWAVLCGDKLIRVQQREVWPFEIYLGMDGNAYHIDRLTKTPCTVTYFLPPKKKV